MNKSLVAMVCGIIAIVLIGIAMVMPWYHGQSEIESEDYSSKSSADAKLYEVTNKWEDNDESEEETTAYSDSDYKDAHPNTVNLFNMIMIIAIIGLVLAVLFVIFVVVAGKGKISTKIGGIFGILAFVFLLLAPLLLMAMFPNAMEEDAKEDIEDWEDPFEDKDASPFKDFFGSIDEDDTKMSWGGSIGWFLSLIAAIFALIGAIIAFTYKKPAPAAVAPDATYPQQQYPPQQVPPMQPPTQQYPPQQPPAQQYPPPPPR